MCFHLSATQKYGIKKLITFHKGHAIIELQKIQMYSVKAAYAITETCDRLMGSKLKLALCKEIVTPLIDSLIRSKPI